MKALIDRFSSSVKGVLSGFDRIVFKGWLLPLMSASQVMSFLSFKGVLNKDYKNWMIAQTREIVNTADQYARDNCGSPIIKIPTWRIRKEELAHKRQQQEQIKTGLIGVWSCMESASSYRAVYCKQAGFPQIKNYQTQCKHLYFYFDDREFGFMNIRLQTWFPYHIQMCLNGREWLRRGLEQEGIDFHVHGNKFLHIADYQKAQQLLDQQLNIRFTDILDGFTQRVFPGMEDILGPHFSYYWTLWQSEWATDLIFYNPDSIKDRMDTLLRHAHIIGTSTRVLRYLDRPLTKAGRPDGRSHDTVMTRLTDFNDGMCIRHWNDKNSVKLYNEQNNVRVETTINDPRKFKVFRHKQGQDENEPKQRLPMRKGVMDIPLRASVSQDVNNRFMEDLATLEEKTPIRSFLDDLTVHITKNGRRFRGLDPVGKDQELLLALSDPAYMVSGLTNKMLRERLSSTPFGSSRTDKQLSAKISRHLRLLRSHGIIRKLPRQNRYQVTTRGMRLTNALNALLAASIENLLKIAA
ncbi:MAG: hypothetical protein WGN25_09375 [Candidatus Electrothrix sp. GW3-4]|uniref:hypothetical protein n=1 Tax=Candidatus Electrothrix sp. GW3-4 TaxID=3126740 RepID=UPI0030D405F2